MRTVIRKTILVWPTCPARSPGSRKLKLPNYDGRVPVEMVGGTSFPAYRPVALPADNCRPTGFSGFCVADERRRAGLALNQPTMAEVAHTLVITSHFGRLTT